MFVVLEHATTLAAGAPPGEPCRHWDLLVELPGAEQLATWRLDGNPLDTDDEIPATRIQDHRRLYLDYEGELSGRRGVVRRVERGTATIDCAGDRVILVLSGQRLHGTFEIAPREAGPLVFRRVP